MTIHKLQNYLRMYRRRTALSQLEIAYLLGCRCGAKVSRYERCARCPSLRTALAYEIVYGTPPDRLFSGMFHEVKRATLRRARALLAKLSRCKPCPLNARKLETLSSVCQAGDTEHKKQL